MSGWIALTCLNAYGITRYVAPGGGNVHPYTNWAMAARTITAAVEAASSGDLILVSNGVYNTGGRPVHGSSLTNRVVIKSGVTVRSVNGPSATIIAGAGPCGDAAVRCAYLESNAVLAGFTLSNGFTRTNDPFDDTKGGGAWCHESAILSNCWILGNTAYNLGGGVRGGTLLNCTVRSNTVVNVSGCGGGACGSALTNCWIQDNSANYQGGGCDDCDVTRCTVFRNRAPYGGGTHRSRLDGCTLMNNQADFRGGGMYRGTANNSHFYGNSADTGGAASDATLRNCVLTDNNAANTGGGTYDGSLYNCTVTYNSALVGGGTYLSDAYNSIIYYNRASRGANTYGGSFSYCCTTPQPLSGSNILTNEPGLASHSHLSKDSPCRGAGNGSFASGTDIDGEPWLTPPSIGCDEFHTGAATGTLVVAAEASSTNAARLFPIFFRATIHGATTESIWNFGDGVRATNCPFVYHTFSGVGAYPVRITAYNDTYPGGITATVTVQVTAPQYHYVRPTNPGATPPYTSWATAATNIQQAIDAATQAGAHVVVSNGIYAVGGRVVDGALTNRVVVNKPVVVESTGGAGVTIIRGTGPLGDSAVRCIYVGDYAQVSGFTLENGATRSSGDKRREQSGGGAWLAPEAKIYKCVVRNCSAEDSGGGIYGGTVQDCELNNNRADWGGGAYESTILGGVIDGNVAAFGAGAGYCDVRESTLTANRASMQGGGGFYSDFTGSLLKENSAPAGGGAFGGQLHHCWLQGNGAAQGGALFWSYAYNSALIGNQAGDGGGAYWSQLYNCTLSGNWATNLGGGVCAGYYINCVIWQNAAGGSGANWSTNDLGWPVTLRFSCTEPLPDGDGNIAADPKFVAAGSGYGFGHSPGTYRLQSNSPCINTGTNFPWMTDPSQPGRVDLDGNPRIFGGGRVDMGAYEYQRSVSCAPTNWLAAHGLPIDGSADQEDGDGDGYTTCEEYISDTDPTSGKSYLPGITNLNNPPVLSVNLSPTSTNRIYDIFSTTNLMANPQVWTPHGFNLPGTSSNLTFVITNSEPRKFFRTGARLP